MVPPRIVEKGGLITGNNYDWAKGIMPEKIAVPPGKDGTFLQADSSTETGLKWAPIPVDTYEYKLALENQISSLKSTMFFLTNELLKQQISELIVKRAEQIKTEEEKAGRGLFYIRVRNFDFIDYPIPFNGGMLIENVLEYVIEKYLYYVGDIELSLSLNGTKLEGTKTVAASNIVVGSNIIAVQRSDTDTSTIFEALVDRRRASLPPPPPAGKGGNMRRSKKTIKHLKRNKCNKRTRRM